MARSTTCKFCGRDGLVWLRFRGAWYLVEPSDMRPGKAVTVSRHRCREYQERATGDTADFSERAWAALDPKGEHGGS